MLWRLTAALVCFNVATCFRPAIENEVEVTNSARLPDEGAAHGNASNCTAERPELQLALQAGDADAVRFFGRGAGLTRVCFEGAALTPLELAVREEEDSSLALALALFDAPGSELAFGLAQLRRRLEEAAQSLPSLASYWNNASDGLDALRRLVPTALHPTAVELETLGDIPQNWLIFYQIKIMCVNAHSSHNASMRREMELLLSAQGFDSFARNYSLGAILLAIILFVFGVMVYVSFRLRAFGWLEAPISLAEMLPGAFAPERLADPDFDPSRQKKQLPYRVVKGQLIARPSSISHNLSSFFQGIFGVYASWLLLCIRIPPEKDTFDEEYLTDDDEECRLKVRDVCAFRAKNVGAVEVIFRALSLCALEVWLLCYTGRYGDAFLLNLLYVCYARMVTSVAASSVPTPMPEKTDCDAELMPGQEMDAAGAVTAIFGVQHGPRWARAQCTTRSTAAPNKTKRQRRLRRRETPDSGNSGTEAEAKDPKDPKDPESPRGEGDGPMSPQSASESSFSDRFQRQLLSAGVMHVQHSELLEQSVVSMCSCFLSVVFLMHLRWTVTGSLKRFYAGSEPLELVQAYGLPDSSDRLMSVAAEVLLMFLCFERLYDMSSLLHVSSLSLKQRNTALRFMREHQPPWAFTGVREVPLQRATSYCEEVVRCGDFALELSDARWRVVQRPVEIVVTITEALLLLALLLIILPFLPLPSAALPGAQGKVTFHLLYEHFRFLEPWLDPVVPLTVGLVIVSPAVNTLLQAHFANAEVARQQSMLRSKVDTALSSAKEQEDVQYVQLRNCSRDALANATLKWSSGRALGLLEPILLLYFALAVVGLAVLTKLNFIIV